MAEGTRISYATTIFDADRAHLPDLSFQDAAEKIQILLKSKYSTRREESLKICCIDDEDLFNYQVDGSLLAGYMLGYPVIFSSAQNQFLGLDSALSIAVIRVRLTPNGRAILPTSSSDLELPLFQFSLPRVFGTKILPFKEHIEYVNEHLRSSSNLIFSEFCMEIHPIDEVPGRRIVL